MFHLYQINDVIIPQTVLRVLSCMSC